MAETDEGPPRRSSRHSGRGVSAKKKALDQIRKFRETGEKVEYSVDDEIAVYDLVDEDKYAQLVQERQEEDFIVDDDGAGYVDDGREIFDDDPNEVPLQAKKAASNKKENAKGTKPTVKSSKITSMFSATTNIQKRKKESNVTLDGDDVLEDILNSIGSSGPPQKAKTSVAAIKTPKRTTHHPPRRLQKGRRMTVKKKSHMAVPVPFKVKQEENYETENNVYTNENEPVSEDSCYASPYMEPIDNNNLVKDEEFDESADLLTADELNDYDINDEMLIDTDVKKEELDEKVNSEMDWESIFDQKYEEKPLPDVGVIPSSFPTTKVNGDEVLRFFWLDAYEDKFHQPGRVYLFGKVWVESSSCFVSCCVAVKNIERQLYLLPRNTRHDRNGKDLGKSVEFKDVYEEFDQKVATKHKIMEYKCRKIHKLYAFDKFEVPVEADYLELIYGANEPQLPADLQGETFSHVFGTNTSSLELLFLNQKLQGPSWVDIKYPQVPKQPISWCKIEAFVDRPSFVTVVEENLPPPPLVDDCLSRNFH